MTYLVDDKCIKCRYTDCVSVCPVDCFYIGENSIAINPDECIDCGVCEPECPAGAIRADTDFEPEEREKWLDINTRMAELWPVITEKIDEMDDADANNPKLNPDIGDKTEFLSENPGEEV